MPVLEGYAMAIEQLFQNLISNAIKFQPENNVPIVEISCKLIQNYWKFTISDNGIGFSKEYEKTLFIIFKRLHTRSEYQGNGIGLAICKRIVDLHDGEIWALSEEGKGSNFYFTLKSN
jgi:light-regulated signal transduction histidine kinase (bacteriophytochrome)